MTEVYGKPLHGWSCDCGECLGYIERGEPRPGEAPESARPTAPSDPPALAAMAYEQMRWWNPRSVLRASRRLQEVKRAGQCPVCDHGLHRDGPCDTCGDRCPYPKTIDAAQDRFAEARADFGQTFRASIERLFRRGR